MYEAKTIRAAYGSGKKNRNQLAKGLGRSWATINTVVHLSDDELVRRGKRKRDKTVQTEDAIARVRELLQEEHDLDVPRKQRMTAIGMYERLVREGVYHGKLRMMQDLVKSVRAELGQVRPASFLPLDLPLGSQIQVDHGEVLVEIGDVQEQAYLFVGTVPGAVLRFCRIYPRKTLESWGDFLEHLFSFYGGIFPKVVTDNDSVLVVREQLTEFALELQAHYGFQLHLCNKAAGWEKGAVENGVGYCRRNFLTGIASFASYEETNSSLKGRSTEVNRSKEDRISALAELCTILTPLLPKRTWVKQTEAKVSPYQFVRADRQQYSVPERFVGALVTVRCAAWNVLIDADGETIATHNRAYGEPEIHIELFHYLEQLFQKPNASPAFVTKHRHSTPERWQRLLSSLERRFGAKDAAHEWLAIALLRKRYPSTAIHEAIDLLLDQGSITAASITCMVTQLMTSEQAPVSGKSLKPLNEKFSLNIPDPDLSQYLHLQGGLLC